jgi:hypothetical protein
MIEKVEEIYLMMKKLNQVSRFREACDTKEYEHTTKRLFKTGMKGC